MKHLLSIKDLNKKKIEKLFDRADELKNLPPLALPFQKKNIVLFFEKPSLRTRVTFIVAIHHLGGNVIELTSEQIKPGGRETIEDIAANLSRWVNAIVARTYSHKTIRALAKHGTVPVINALSDLEHPCQALADFYTIRNIIRKEKKNWSDIRLAYVGDGNNVCHSLMLSASYLGCGMSVVCPRGFSPLKKVEDQCRKTGSPGQIKIIHDIEKGVAGADFVYTDVWASMGQEAERTTRMPIFRPYQVNRKLMGMANRGARFMHCLPAHRGEEVTADILEGNRSVVLDQAENRMHVQKAVMYNLLKERT